MNFTGRVLRNVIFIIVIQCFFGLQLSAQQFVTRNYTMKDGLPSMAVRCVFKDSKGLVWIGTDGGLCTFDGEKFRVFNRSEGFTASKVWSITEDEFGNMWFGCFGDGVMKFDGKKLSKITEKQGLDNNWIRVMHYSEKYHCLVTGSSKGISIIKGDTVELTSKSFFKEAGAVITGIAESGDAILFSTYIDASPVYYLPDKKFFSYGDKKGKCSKAESFGCFISSKGDTIWSEDKGIHIFKTDTVIHFDNIGQVFGIDEDKNGNIWMAAWSFENIIPKGGVYKYDGSTLFDFTKKIGITDIEIWDVTLDNEQDIIWVCTLNEGLYMVPPIIFNDYNPGFFGVEKLNINSIFMNDANELWISDKKNLIRKKADDSFEIMDNERFMSLINEASSQQNRNHTTGSPKPKSKNLLNLILQFNSVGVYQENYRMIVTNYGTFLYNTSADKLAYLGGQITKDFAFVGNDTLIQGGWGSLSVFTNFSQCRSVKENPLRHTNNENTDIADVSRIVKNGNQVWIASWVSGLWIKDGNNFVHLDTDNDSISHDLVDICFDKQGHIIFGSITGILYISTYQDKKLKINYQLDNSNGLVGNTITWLSVDKNGFLWIGTNSGINRLNISELYETGNLVFNFFDEEEGFIGQSAQRVAWDKSGNLWLGASEKLVKMATNALEFKNELEVIVKKIEVNHQSIYKEYTLSNNRYNKPSEPLKLNYKQKDIGIYFGVLNFVNPKKDKFRYKLEGNDNNWSSWTSETSIFYSNLPTGKYIFKVESKNLNSALQAKPLLLYIEITPPWWLQWYIQSFMVIILIIGTVLLYRKRVENIRYSERQKAEIKTTIAQLEMQALRSQMNPHFIFNSINNIQYYVLTNKTDTVLTYLSDFSKVVRASLENASKKMIPLNQEIDFLNSYLRLEMMRFSDKFSYSIEMVDDSDPLALWIPPMIVQPFIENSIRHGLMHKESKGKLEVTFEKISDEVIKCTITDDGVGRKKVSEMKSIGLEDDRLHSSKIIETRIGFFNSPDFPNKFKVVYTDLMQDDDSTGLKVEVFLPVEFHS